MVEPVRLESTLSEWDSLPPRRLRFAAKVAGKVMARAYRLTGKDRYDDFRLERVRGLPFVVMPTVFNPKIPRSGEFLAAQLDDSRVHADSDVLDMGSGSGVCAVFAARLAHRVVAVDINMAAVRCTRINAALNRLEHRIDVRHGDLFGPVCGERFDLVLFNPPFLRGAPQDDRDRAWRSIDVVERFADGLGGHLKPGGAALVVLSTFGEPAVFLSEFRNRGFCIRVRAEQPFVNEKLAIFELTPGADVGSGG